MEGHYNSNMKRLAIKSVKLHVERGFLSARKILEILMVYLLMVPAEISRLVQYTYRHERYEYTSKALSSDSPTHIHHSIKISD